MEFLFSLFLTILIFVVSYMGAHNLEYEHERAMTWEKRSRDYHKFIIEVEIRSKTQKRQINKKKGEDV